MASDTAKLELVDVNVLLDLDLPPPEALLEPWLFTQGLGMIHAPRGIGKTHVGLGIAAAMSTGDKFLKWNAPKPRRVVFVDGEMPAVTVQERLHTLFKAIGRRPEPGYFRILTPDLLDRAMPNFSAPTGQSEFREALGDLEEVDVVLLDNISTLFLGGKENEGESWTPAQQFSLLLRRNGVAVVFVHHSGKSGEQRGTSRREDILDTVIKLQHPHDYKRTEGARFEVHFEKSRRNYGPEVDPFEAKLEVRDGKAQWTIKNVGEKGVHEVVEHAIKGLSQREIAAEVGISVSTVSRRLRKARELGLIGEDEMPEKGDDDDLQKNVFKGGSS